MQLVGRRLTIGVTFFLRASDCQSIFENGATQNCVFLVQLLKAAGHKVFAINAGDGDKPHDALMLRGLGIEFARFGDVYEQLDVLIEAAAQVSAGHVSLMRRSVRGGWRGYASAYRFGNAYVIDGERTVFGKSSGSIFNGAQFDEVWTTPQHENTCSSYWEVCHRCPVRIMPHIWEPTFVDAAVKEFPAGEHFGYRPGRERKRISILEPNIGMVKLCHIPMLACELAFRERPDLIDKVQVTNTTHIREHQTFANFAGNLDMVKAKHSDGKSVCSFEDRFNTPMWLAKYTDVVVSHQWENSKNYMYYDALYGGYPLVHNADLPSGVGYNYPGFSAHKAGDVLLDVLSDHDSWHEEYVSRAHKFLDTVRATAPANIEAHERAFAELN